MNALRLVVSDKKIFENCIWKTYFWTLWPTYATKWNSLNNFDRGPPRDHSCEVWSKSNEWFQRRCLSKKVYARRTTTDDGRQRQRPITIDHHEHFVLRWAKKIPSMLKQRWHDGVSTHHSQVEVIVKVKVGSPRKQHQIGSYHSNCCQH